MIKMQICRSHERNSNPKAWEDFFEGTEEECREKYDDLSRMFRFENDFRFIRSDGFEMNLFDLFP